LLRCEEGAAGKFSGRRVIVEQKFLFCKRLGEICEII
jgi:hypothetical protein